MYVGLLLNNYFQFDIHLLHWQKHEIDSGVLSFFSAWYFSRHLKVRIPCKVNSTRTSTILRYSDLEDICLP